MRASFIFSEVTTGLRRNLTMTFAMILTTTITLAMFGSGLLVVQLASKSEKIFLDRVEMMLYVQDAVSAVDPHCQKEVCLKMRTQIEKEPGVGSVRFITREEAQRNAKTSFAKDPVFTPLIEDVALPASFRVRMDDVKKFSNVIDKFATAPGFDGALDQRQMVKRIFDWLNGARNAAFIIAVVQAVVAIFLIVNMVQIAAFTRRTEVGIMRLVGATRWYTQLPFLVEAIFATMVGAILAIGALWLAQVSLFDKAFAELYRSDILTRITTADVFLVAPWLFIGGIVVSGLTSYVTLRLYVRE